MICSFFSISRNCIHVKYKKSYNINPFSLSTGGCIEKILRRGISLEIRPNLQGKKHCLKHCEKSRSRNVFSFSLTACLFPIFRLVVEREKFDKEVRLWFGQLKTKLQVVWVCWESVGAGFLTIMIPLRYAVR